MRDPASDLGDGSRVITYRAVNKGYVAMSPQEAWGFIASRTKMTVAFRTEIGAPHLSTVWFCVRRDLVYFKGRAYKVKMRFVDNGKTSCLWEDGERFGELRGVVMRGTSRVVVEPELRQEILVMLSEKYAGSLPALSPRHGDETVVEIRPEEISTWDNRKLGARA